MLFSNLFLFFLLRFLCCTSWILTNILISNLCPAILILLTMTTCLLNYMLLTCLLTCDMELYFHTDLYIALLVEFYVEAVFLDEYTAGGRGDEKSCRVPVWEQRQRRVHRDAERHEPRRPEKHRRKGRVRIGVICEFVLSSVWRLRGIRGFGLFGTFLILHWRVSSAL